MSLDYYANFDRITSEMDQTRVKSDSIVSYDVLADALVWSDEYPANTSGRLSEFDCVKLLLRYRTTLLLGKPDDLFKPYWDYAKKLFPNWAGFCPSRLMPNQELISIYKHESKWAMRRLEKFGKIDLSTGESRNGNES